MRRWRQKIQSRLRDRSLIEFGTWRRQWLDWQRAEGLQGGDGGRGDRWHSGGGPTGSDTTQGASVAGCRASQDSGSLRMQITHSRFSPEMIIYLITMIMNNDKHSIAIPHPSWCIVSTSKSV